MDSHKIHVDLYMFRSLID